MKPRFHFLFLVALSLGAFSVGLAGTNLTPTSPGGYNPDNPGTSDESEEPEEENPCPGKDKCKKCGSIEVEATLAFAPNEPGLGVGMVKYFIDTTNVNLGARSILTFNGVPYMQAVATVNGSSTSFEITQEDGTLQTFVLPYPVPPRLRCASWATPVHRARKQFPSSQP